MSNMGDTVEQDMNSVYQPKRIQIIKNLKILEENLDFEKEPSLIPKQLRLHRHHQTSRPSTHRLPKPSRDEMMSHAETLDMCDQPVQSQLEQSSVTDITFSQPPFYKTLWSMVYGWVY